MSKSLANNSLILLASQFLIYTIQFLIVVRLLAVLDLEVYGLIAFSQAFMAVALMLLDFGFSVSATNKISKHRHRKKYVAKLVSSIIFIKLVLFCLMSASVVLFFILSDSYDVYEKIIFLSLPAIFALAITPVWFFYGIERLFYYSLCLILGKIFFAVLVYFFITSNDEYYYFPIFSLIGQIIVLIYFAFFLYQEKILPYVRLDLNFTVYAVYFTKDFIFSRLALSVNTSGGALVLGMVGGPANVGLYSLVDQIYRVLQTCVGSLTTPLYAYTSRNKDVKLVIKIALILMLILSLFSFLLYFVKDLVLSIIDFPESQVLSALLGFFIIIFWLNSFGTVIGYPLYAALSRLFVVNRSLIAGSLIYSLLLLFFFYKEVSDVMSYAFALIFVELYILLHRLVSYVARNPKVS